MADLPSMVNKLKNTAWLVASPKRINAYALENLDFIPVYFEVDMFWHDNGHDMR